MQYIFKIQLTGVSKPPVWRRIMVPVTYSFYEFSDVIQLAFGWAGMHLYQFSPKGYGSHPVIADTTLVDDADADAEEVMLNKYFTKPGDTFTYIYDFGDDWQHTIILEKFADGDLDHAVCLEGKGACPPENCGGVPGYIVLKEIFANPKHPEYEDMKEVVGLREDEAWDPNEFDIDEVNEMLAENEDWADDGLQRRPSLPIQPPVLNHPELSVLYEKSASIDRALLKRFLELPRATLVEDLRTILRDTVRRYTDFIEHDREEHETFFVLHALNMLSVLKAEEALEDVLEVFGQDMEFHEFFFGDILTEEAWQYFYWLGQNQLGRLKQLVLKPSVYTYAGSAVATAVCHISRIDGKHDEALAWFGDILGEMYARHEASPDDFDKILFSMLTGDLIEFGEKAYLPLIQKFYEGQLVSSLEAYTWKKAVEILHSGKESFQLYRDVCSTIDQFYDRMKLYDWDEDDVVVSEPSYYPPVYPPFPFLTQPKAGRNDPCPCGSGKKFKKCCGNN